ncbi:hypothetical protein VKT23_007891 [Stygiomarasmius scandens]|uniref:Uncharacterized protein n=1 Tax=Marasmiellus scandens TaxID=2682957 RepID=A0ABR1JP57_9AGAR
MMGSWTETLLLVLWKTFESFSGLPLFIFVITLIVLDTVTAEQRTFTLSRVTGLTNLGSAISFSIGGNLTNHSSNVLPVYVVAAVIHAISLVYAAIFLPESFTREKRVNLQRQQVESRSYGNERCSVIRYVHSAFLRVFGPLEFLKSASTERKKSHLIYFATHIFLAQMASGYAVVSMLVFLTTQFKYKPVDTGYLLTVLNLTRTCVLIILIPYLVRLLRPIYLQRRRRNLREESNESTAKVDRLDLHLTIISWVLEGLAFILLGQAKTKPGHFTAVTLHGLSAGKDPIFRSLVASCVDPLNQTDALAAVEMVSSIGVFISPFLMGGILTATINTIPSLVFWVDGVIVMLAASILLMVKDTGRTLSEAQENED